MSATPQGDLPRSSKAHRVDRAARRPGRPKLTEPSPQHVQRLEEIVTTAAGVFRSKGYDAGTLEDVAAEMGLNKASLYHYVSSKAELLHRVFDRAITLALARLDELGHLDDPKERLAALISHQVRMIAEEPELFIVFFDNRPRLDETYEASIRAKEHRYLRIFAEAVSAASAAGCIPAVDSRLGAQALLGMTTWTYKWFDPARDNPELVAGTFIQLVLSQTAGTARPHTSKQ
ncbi:MAG: TetR/AcrR family transcriptional regulator [Actinobacteria bacterium]|nr:TetR/AcrR family transcriptional regulator [Actinomycetota bacterium]